MKKKDFSALKVSLIDCSYIADIRHLEAKIHELDAMNTDLTDLYNKHMESWVERENSLNEKIKMLEKTVRDLCKWWYW